MNTNSPALSPRATADVEALIRAMHGLPKNQRMEIAELIERIIRDDLAAA